MIFSLLLTHTKTFTIMVHGLRENPAYTLSFLTVHETSILCPIKIELLLD
jgi:hypothetical protein